MVGQIKRSRCPGTRVVEYLEGDGSASAIEQTSGCCNMQKGNDWFRRERCVWCEGWVMKKIFQENVLRMVVANDIECLCALPDVGPSTAVCTFQLTYTLPGFCYKVIV